ncbi:unnamed protein product [Knipowitschia caucasica]
MEPTNQEEVFPDPEQALDSDPESAAEKEQEEEDDDDEEEVGRIFTAWMQRCRGEEEPMPEVIERTGSRISVDPPPMRVGRRASLPTVSNLSSTTLSRLHSSTAAPVTAKLLLRRTSSRRLLPSPQEVPPPPGERRGSLAPLHAPPSIPEKAAPLSDLQSKPQPEQCLDKPNVPEKKGHFRRRNVMSLSDADSVCLICHNDLKHGTGGSRELQCSHTFHKECIEEYLWRKQQCPTCHVQVSLPQNLLWSSTLKVP